MWLTSISGRTARIGNEGLATSFYNDKDEGMGPFLTKILMETNQEVPEFLQHFKPEDGVLNFNEEEEEPDMVTTDGGPDGGAAWGSGDAMNNGAGDNNGAGGNTAGGDAWGAAVGNDAAAAPVAAWGAVDNDGADAGAAW
jgi:ATP-dependent RNA helicase DDX3X